MLTLQILFGLELIKQELNFLTLKQQNLVI